MSRLDWCQNVLLKHSCYDWKNDNCDGCNIFQAYCEGATRAKETKRKNGEWYRKYAFQLWRCSVCEYESDGKTNYCPNCGANMRGDNNATR